MQPRVVRVALEADRTDCRLSVNGANRSGSLSGSQLTQKLALLRLHHGDVMLLGFPRAEGSTPAKNTKGWLLGFCQSNNVSVYLMLEPFPGVDMFSVRTYHWTAPHDDPFDLASASFFCEGRLVGRSTNGFEGMLHQIAHDRPKQIFILGSRSSPGETAPYERQEDRLYSTLKAAGTDFVQLDALP
jgi:hypothetical protein